MTTPAIDATILSRMRARLVDLYGDQADACLDGIAELAESHRAAASPATPRRWDQRDVVLITYGDQVSSDDATPLRTLRRFLTDHDLARLINTVHILPFSPYSSDDGFSVIDYRQVNPDFGNWDDVHSLGERVDLMFDLVLNHCSAQSQWFQDYLAGTEPFTKYFIEADPNDDLSAVTRPRSLPLLTPVETSRGERHVWTTFSADQVDLNFAEPDVLLELLDILLSYVRHGARIVRLDAIAYLWKQIGTNCIHLPETHEVVKLMRDLLDAVAPHVLLLTETNVPHKENVSYFGNGDEAHMVYQFSLPPLLLDAFLSGEATALATWLANLDAAQPGTTFFNFTASHDGVGVRPLEGLVPDQRVQQLATAVRDRGGLVSTRRQSDGIDSPYELNVSYVDALSDPAEVDADLHAKRFLASQALMLALPGVPGIYFHSLVGTQNHHEGVEQTGQPRRINRRKFDIRELLSGLETPGSLQQQIFVGYQKLLSVRIDQPAFHPDASFAVHQSLPKSVVAFSRTSTDDSQTILVVANVSRESQTPDLSEVGRAGEPTDLLSGRSMNSGNIVCQPFEVLWLDLADAAKRGAPRAV